jgi:thiol-disulfide isomerase/thioredoxin
MRPLCFVVLMTACTSVDMTVDGPATMLPVISDDVHVSEEADPLTGMAVHADSDDDNLCDAEERVLGSDPFDEDSDGDHYKDGDEVLAGSDLLDPNSVIYRGGWPFNAYKDHIVGAAPGRPVVGEVFSRYALEDQHGDMVDFYDFLGGESYTWVQVSATWCASCREVAFSLASDGASPLDGYFPSIRGLVESGKVNILTVLAAGEEGDATMDDVAEWAETWPIKNVAVLGDVDQDLWDGVEGVTYPLSFLLASDGTVVAMSEGDEPPAVMMWLEENLGSHDL